MTPQQPALASDFISLKKGANRSLSRGANSRLVIRCGCQVVPVNPGKIRRSRLIASHPRRSLF